MHTKDSAAYAAAKYISIDVRENALLMPFLQENLKGASRNKVKDILTGRGVMVDRKVITRHDFELRPGMQSLVSRHKRST